MHTFALTGDLLDRQPVSRVKRLAAVAGTLLVAVTMAVTMGVGGASADDLQCGGIADTPGLGIDCQVSVVNNLNLDDPTQTSSTVTTVWCTAAAGPVLAGFCDDPDNYTTTVIDSPTLVTDISQCNYSANGSGGVVYCTVDILNQVTGVAAAAPVAATINECNGSAVGGGGTINCNGWVDPSIAAPTNVSVTGADVVQCNDSAIGGGNVVDCSVATGSTVSADLTIHVNQCNNSENLNGAVVICRTRVRTVTRATTADAYTTNTATFTPLPTSPANGLAAPLQVGTVPPTSPPVTPPVTPPATPPTSTGGTTSRTSTASSTVSSRDRLVNTGSLASTGTDPSPLGLVGILVILLGITGVVTTKRMGIRKIG